MILVITGISKAVASKLGGQGAPAPPPFFCNAVSYESSMKNIEITNGFIFKKHVGFLTFRLPMILYPWQVCHKTISGLLLNPTYNFTSDRLFVPFFLEIVNVQRYPFILYCNTDRSGWGRYYVLISECWNTKFQNTHFATSHCLI